jgi:hypothetical protein
MVSGLPGSATVADSASSIASTLAPGCDGAASAFPQKVPVTSAALLVTRIVLALYCGHFGETAVGASWT